MPTKFTRLAILQRRKQVAELYLCGTTQLEIAAQLKVGQATVSRDLREIAKEWRTSAVRDFDVARGAILCKLDRIEREAWKAWEESCKPQYAVHQITKDGKQETRKQVLHRQGDTTFLTVIARCVEQRREILGLDPDGVPVNSTIAECLSPTVFRERILTKLEELKKREEAYAAARNQKAAVPLIETAAVAAAVPQPAGEAAPAAEASGTTPLVTGGACPLVPAC